MTSAPGLDDGPQGPDDFSREAAGPIATSLRRALLARRLPRAELHVHLTGALRPSLTRRVKPVTGRVRADSEHDYHGIEVFFARHREFAGRLTSADAVTAAVQHVLEGAVDAGCRHLELSVNHSEFAHTLGLPTALRAAGAAFTAVGETTGLTGGLVVAMDRAANPEQAFETIRLAAVARGEGVPVLGIGNDGFPAAPLTAFAHAFAVARDSGLRTTAHANTSRDVREALELGLDRIDHAWELQGRPDLQSRLAQTGTPVTMAMTSCLTMLPGRFPTAESFPFEELRSAGVRVTLNVDDAALFFTDSAREYELAAATYGWDDATLAQVALASLEAAWLDVDDAVRQECLQQWRSEIAALLDDPRAPQPPSSTTTGERP